MGNSRLYLAGLAALSMAVNGRVFLPRATMKLALPSNGISPRPTAPPAVNDLRRRQSETSSEVTTVLVAPDNTCGYVSGLPGAAYTCGRDATCLFFTASREVPGRVVCCDSEDCNLRTTCYDMAAVSTSSLCDDGCLVNAFDLKCTETTARFCNTISFPNGIIDYWCNTVSISTAQEAETTYNGESDTRSFIAVALTDEITDTTSGLVRPTLITTTTTRDSSSTGTSTSATTTTTGGGGGGGGGGSSTPVGPIVGGVIGGVAIIAIVGFGIFFLLRHNKKQKQQQSPPQNLVQTTYPPMQQQSPSGFGPTPHQSMYGSDNQQPYVQNYQTPPPGQEYMGTPPQPYQQTPSPGAYYPAGTVPPNRGDTASPMSNLTDNRVSSLQPSSPGHTNPEYQQPPYGQQQPPPQPTIYEAGGAEHHRGQMHELAS